MPSSRLERGTFFHVYFKSATCNLNIILLWLKVSKKKITLVRILSTAQSTGNPETNQWILATVMNSSNFPASWLQVELQMLRADPDFIFVFLQVRSCADVPPGGCCGSCEGKLSTSPGATAVGCGGDGGGGAAGRYRFTT